VVPLKHEFDASVDKVYGDAIQIVTSKRVPRGLKEAWQEETAHRSDYRYFQKGQVSTNVFKGDTIAEEARTHLRKTYKNATVDYLNREIGAKIHRADAPQALGISPEKVEYLQNLQFLGLLDAGVTSDAISKAFDEIEEAGRYYEEISRNVTDRANDRGSQGDRGTVDQRRTDEVSGQVQEARSDVTGTEEGTSGKTERGFKLEDADRLSRLRQASLNAADRSGNQVALAKSKNRGTLPSKAWRSNFPTLFAHTTVAKLKAHPKYNDAKRGDALAALKVALDLVKPDRLRHLAKLYPEAIVLPVREIEDVGTNKLPSALAVLLEQSGLEMDTQIVSESTVSRKNKSAVERLVAHKKFTGEVQSGRQYILVDDVATQGGTFNDLRAYIENNGGTVVAASALSFAAGGNIIAPRAETIKRLREKFNDKELTKFINEFRIAEVIEALTEGQIHAILRFSNIAALESRFAQAGISRRRRPDAPQFTQTQSLTKLDDISPDDEIQFARASSEPSFIKKTASKLNWKNAIDVATATKSLKASADLSAAGRQGIILSVTEPRIAGRSFWRQIKSFRQAHFERFKQYLNLHPYIELAEDSGLYLASLANNTDINEREEAFMSRLFADERLFGNKAAEAVRRVVAFPIHKSEAAYVTYLDNLRMETFVKFSREVHEFNTRNGREDDIEQYKALADFISTFEKTWFH
jgi:hypothetical protein